MVYWGRNQTPTRVLWLFSKVEVLTDPRWAGTVGGGQVSFILGENCPAAGTRPWCTQWKLSGKTRVFLYLLFSGVPSAQTGLGKKEMCVKCWARSTSLWMASSLPLLFKCPVVKVCRQEARYTKACPTAYWVSHTQMGSCKEIAMYISVWGTTAQFCVLWEEHSQDFKKN